MQTRVVHRLPQSVCFLYSEISCIVSLKSTPAGLSPSHPQPTLFPASAPSLLAGGGWWTWGRRGTTAYCVVWPWDSSSVCTVPHIAVGSALAQHRLRSQLTLPNTSVYCSDFQSSPNTGRDSHNCAMNSLLEHVAQTWFYFIPVFTTGENCLLPFFD